jgi:hypothetical protein
MPPRRARALTDEERALEQAREERMALERQLLVTRQLVARNAEREREALLPLLCELSDAALSAFLAALLQQLRAWPKFGTIAGLLSPESQERLVRDVVDALARNTRGAHGRVQTTFNLQVNGDVQRGKSTMEAFQALCVKYINDSPAVRDRCFSVLGTQMVPWAADVSNKMQNAAMGPVPPRAAAARAAGAGAAGAGAGAAADADAGAEDAEADTHELEEALGPLFRVTPICGPRGSKHTWDDELQRTAREGGCIVFSRTRLRIDRVIALLFRLSSQQREAGLTVSAHFVILDEADKMRGTGDERTTGYEYEIALSELCGGVPVCANNRHGVALPAALPAGEAAAREWLHLRACMVSDVSATNGLCFFALLHRLGAPGHKLMDVISFKDDPENYVGFSRCTEFNGGYLSALRPAEHNVNDAVLDVYAEALATDWACVLDCTTSTVNAGTAAPTNMQAHAAAVVAALEARDPELLETRGMAFVFVHGGARTFGGRVGVCFAGAGVEERLEELRDALRGRNGGAGGARSFAPFALPDAAGRYIDNEMLRPLLIELEDGLEAASRGYRRLMRDSMDLEQLSLTLLLLRSRWPGLPVAVVGYGMVRRSLSVVAVDAAGQCVLAVTHEIQWATPSANAADVTQQFLRASTTLSTFHAAHGFPLVKVLAPAHVWTTVTGAVLFNCWFSQRFTAAGAPLNRDDTVVAFERIEAAVGRGMERSRAVYRYLDMPAGVRGYFASKNAFHLRSTALKTLARRVLRRHTRAEAAEAEDDEGDGDETEEESGDEAADADAGDAAAYRRLGPAVRLAHKAEAMARLRAWLLRQPERPRTLADAEAHFRGAAAAPVAGVAAWTLIDSVLTHQSRARVWALHGVWRGRSETDEALLCLTQPEAPEWVAPGTAQPGAPQPAPPPPPALPEGFAEAQAALLAWLTERQWAHLLEPLRGVLGVWRVEQLAVLREANLEQLHATLPLPGLPFDDRQRLLAAARPGAPCGRCGERAQLIANDPCGCAHACAACTRAFRADAAHGEVCSGCGAPSQVVIPEEVTCPICLEVFGDNEAEVFAFTPCGHKFDIACAVSSIRRAMGDRLNLLPMKCETCRADVAATAGGAHALPPLRAESLRPLLARSATLLLDPSAPPLTRRELAHFEEEHAAAQGLLARCPRAGCGRATLLALDQAHRAPRVACAACALPFCHVCSTPWHEGQTCEAWREAQAAAADDATTTFFRDHVRRCPTRGCTALMGIHERGHRCHHIRCHTCHADYCFACAAPWNGGCTSGCAAYCDDRCRCPDCVVCLPGQPCHLCDDDGRCRRCQPALRGQRRAL